MAHHGKTYEEAKKRFDREREYSPAEAVALIKQLARVKFNESVEVHVRTGLNVRHADEQLRGTIALPNGLGKDVKVSGMRTSSCVARSRSRTGSARTSRSRSSPRATRHAKPRRRARTSSAPRTSPNGSRMASTTSTSRSRRPT